MTNLENPLSFSDSKNLFGHKIEMVDQIEVCQGGPVIGDLIIDGRRVMDSQFGGPIWPLRNGVIAPIFERSFFSSGFRVALVDYDGGKTKICSSRYDVVWIIECDEINVRFSIHLDGSGLRTCAIS